MPQPPHHTSIARGTYSSDQGTPDWVLDIARQYVGNFTLDLCSSEHHNKIVKARRFHSLEKPCPRRPRVQSTGVVWCNPPGPCGSVGEFWQTWLYCVCEKAANGAFLFFNIDHWRQLPPPPMELPAIVLRRRIRFLGNENGASFPSVLVLSPCHDALRSFDHTYGHSIMWRP
jgi:hypothetical protein